jgi:hypothetical protein
LHTSLIGSAQDSNYGESKLSLKAMSSENRPKALRIQWQRVLQRDFMVIS